MAPSSHWQSVGVADAAVEHEWEVERPGELEPCPGEVRHFENRRRSERELEPHVVSGATH